MTKGRRNPAPVRSSLTWSDSIPSIVTIFIYALLVREMWSLWTFSKPADFPRLQTLSVMMGFEFLLVHSALLCNFMPRRVSILFLLPVYGVVAYCLNTGAENNLILFLYGALIITRLRFLFTDHSVVQKTRAIKISIVSAALYVFAVAIIAIGETSLPRGGLTSEFVKSSGYAESSNVQGIFTEQPHLPLILGMIYFSLMTFFELYLLLFRRPISEA